MSDQKTPEHKPHPGLSVPDWWKNANPSEYVWFKDIEEASKQ